MWKNDSEVSFSTNKLSHFVRFCQCRKAEELRTKEDALHDTVFTGPHEQTTERRINFYASLFWTTQTAYFKSSSSEDELSSSRSSHLAEECSCVAKFFIKFSRVQPCRRFSAPGSSEKTRKLFIRLVRLFLMTGSVDLLWKTELSHSQAEMVPLRKSAFTPRSVVLVFLKADSNPTESVLLFRRKHLFPLIDQMGTCGPEAHNGGKKILV